MASFPVPYWGFLHRILLIFFLLFSTVFLISIFICLILNFSTLPIIFKLQFLVWAQPHSPVCMVMFIESSRSICFRFAFDGVNFEFTVCLQRNVLTGCSRGSAYLCQWAHSTQDSSCSFWYISQGRMKGLSPAVWALREGRSFSMYQTPQNFCWWEGTVLTRQFYFGDSSNTWI